MSGNNAPQFTLVANIGIARVTAANTSSDGGGTIGTDISKVLTAGSNGTYVDKVRWVPVASAAGTATTATVGRLFISTVGSSTVTNADTHLWEEITLPAITADSTSTAVTWFEMNLQIRLLSTQFLHATTHAAAAANTAWRVIAIGGDY